MEPDGQYEHTFDHVRRSDGELVGYIAMDAEGRFVPFDLLRRQCGEGMELDEAEDLLDRLGLGVLNQTMTLSVPGEQPQRVRITELTRDHITVSPILDDLDPAGNTGLDLTSRRSLELPCPYLQP